MRVVTIGKHSLDSDHTRQRTERRSDFESGKQSDFIVFQQPIPTIARLGLVGRGRACKLVRVRLLLDKPSSRARDRTGTAQAGAALG
jgi:hypothetical protein